MCQPTYNFYNCCNSGDHNNNNNNNNNTEQSLGLVHLQFPYRQAKSQVWTGILNNHGYGYQIKVKDPSRLVIFDNVKAVPFRYRIKKAAFAKYGENGSTSQKLNLQFIIMDFNGNILRTASASPINLVTQPTDTWIEPPLSSLDVNIIVEPGEVLVAQVTISAINSDTYGCMGDCSILAEVLT